MTNHPAPSGVDDRSSPLLGNSNGPGAVGSGADAAESPVDPQRRSIPGRTIVIGLLLAGVVTWSGVYWYWNDHARPFRRLTFTLARTFPDSMPKAEGGLWPSSSRVMRVGLRLTFDPATDRPRVAEMQQQVLQLIRENCDLSLFARCELHFLYVPLRGDPIHEGLALSIDELLARTAAPAAAGSP